MKKIFITGGMGAGKSTARKALESLGLPAIDLDALGHEVLEMPDTKADIAEAFGADVFDDDGEVVRSRLAAKAFATPEATAVLESISLPRIADLLETKAFAYEKAGAPALIVESSSLKNRKQAIPIPYCNRKNQQQSHESSRTFVGPNDIVVAITAPLELRVQRAVAKGFPEADVRRRIAAQPSDEERTAEADVVFVNSGTPKQLASIVTKWWQAAQN